MAYQMCTRSRVRYMLRIFHISSTGSHTGRAHERRAEVGSSGPIVKFVTHSGIQGPEFVYKSRCTCKFPDSRLEDVQEPSVSPTQEVADRQFYTAVAKTTDPVDIYKALQGVEGSAELVQVNCLDCGRARDRRDIRVCRRSAAGYLVSLVQGCPKLREMNQSDACAPRRERGVRPGKWSQPA